MSESYNLCIIKPNKSAFSETFIQEHITRLAGNKKVLYGGAFPVYDDEDKFLIRSKLSLLIYLVQKKIFEPFFTTKEVGEGTGLGLSIAYNTIKKHNGRIVVNSTPGEGTEFIIEIPIIFNAKAT